MTKKARQLAISADNRAQAAMTAVGTIYCSPRGMKVTGGLLGSNCRDCSLRKVCHFVYTSDPKIDRFLSLKNFGAYNCAHTIWSIGGVLLDGQKVPSVLPVWFVPTVSSLEAVQTLASRNNSTTPFAVLVGLALLATCIPHRCTSTTHLLSRKSFVLHAFPDPVLHCRSPKKPLRTARRGRCPALRGSQVHGLGSCRPGDLAPVERNIGGYQSHATHHDGLTSRPVPGYPLPRQRRVNRREEDPPVIVIGGGPHRLDQNLSRVVHFCTVRAYNRRKMSPVTGGQVTVLVLVPRPWLLAPVTGH